MTACSRSARLGWGMGWREGESAAHVVSTLETREKRRATSLDLHYPGPNPPYLLNLRQVPHMAPAQSQSELVLSKECEARRRGANALHFALDFEDEPRVTQKRPLQYRNGSEVGIRLSTV